MSRMIRRHSSGDFAPPFLSGFEGWVGLVSLRAESRHSRRSNSTGGTEKADNCPEYFELICFWLSSGVVSVMKIKLEDKILTYISQHAFMSERILKSFVSTHAPFS